MTTGSRTEGIKGIGSEGFIRTVKNLTVTGDLVVHGETRSTVGTGHDVSAFWEVADSNANYWAYELPSGGAVAVPVMGVGIGLKDVDLGLFDGVTQTTFAVLDADRDSYLILDFSADDSPRIRSNQDITFSGNVVFSDNITVNGTTTTVSSSVVIIDDPLFHLANDNPADSVDLGIIAEYTDSGKKFAGLFRDASDSDKWKLFATSGNSHEEPSTTVNTTSGFTLANLAVNELDGTLTTASQTNITGVGTITTGTWEGTTVAVDQGGTGATTLNNLITLTTHTTGNYVATITGGTGIDSDAATSGEGTTHTLSVDLAEVGEVAIADGDYIAFMDATDSNATKKEALADVATLFAGTGLTAASSVIGVDAAQSGITSLGTLTALQVDYINANASTVTITDSSDTGDYFSIATTTHGATTITTVDDDAAAANLTLTIDGNVIVGAHVLPGTDDSYDLGSASAAWQDLFLEGDITLTDAGSIGTSAGNLTLSAAAGADILIGDDVVLLAVDGGTGSIAINPAGASGEAVNWAVITANGAFTSGGASSVLTGLDLRYALTAVAGDTSWQTQAIIRGSITTQNNSETVADISTLRLLEPTITKGNDTVTNAATLIINAAPTEGTNNYALLVDDGDSRFDGMVYINDTSNGNMTIGLTINQGANDNEILALKSSDVAHGITGLTDTDNFMYITKMAAAGGVNVEAFSAASATTALNLFANGQADDTDRSTSATGYGMLDSSKKSGTNRGAPGSDSNLWVIRSNANTRFIFDNEGSGHADVEWVAFDSYNDLALMDAVQTVAQGRMTPERYGDNPLYYHREYLESTGIIGRNSWHEEEGKSRQMVNFTKLAMLHHGAILQIGDVIKSTEERLHALEVENRELKALIER